MRQAYATGRINQVAISSFPSQNPSRPLLHTSSEMDWSDERSQGYLVNRGSSNMYTLLGTFSLITDRMIFTITEFELMTMNELRRTGDQNVG